MPLPSPPPPPSFPPLPTSTQILPPIAQRILHSLNTCTSPSQLPQIQSQIILHNLHPNTTITSSFILTSLSLHSLSPALRLFSLLRRPHIFICNTLLRALSHLPNPSLPLLIFSQMLNSSIPPNNYTYPLVLKSLSRLPQLPIGRSLHSRIVKSGLSSDLYIQNSLLNLYSCCCDMDSCRQLFDEMPVKEVISWTTIIMGYKNNRKLDEALIAFERMQYSGVLPNRVTMVSALVTCAAHGAIDMGVWIHDFIKRSGWELDVVLGTSLVDMYGKCGRIDVGVSVFLSMGEKNVYTWNSLIGGLALAKSGKEALRWFFRMEDEGIKPDAVTLIGVLSACSHSGLVEMGRRIFDSVSRGDYGFYPGIKHYGCMVDLLGRAGFLDEALKCIEAMPFKPSVVIWGSLLGACRAHGDLMLSEVAAKRLVELEPENVAHYVLLSNLYAEMGMWRDAEEVRRVIRERGLRKDAGWSFAEPDEIEYCVEEAFRSSDHQEKWK